MSLIRINRLSLPHCCAFFPQVVSGFEVTRRILVDLEGMTLRRKWLAGLEPENVHMMIGSSLSGIMLLWIPSVELFLMQTSTLV